MEYIRDKYNNIIGQLWESGPSIYAKDFYGNILGYYIKSSDITHDKSGNYLGKGNLLVGLIYANNMNHNS